MILRLAPIMALGLGLAACSNPPPPPAPRAAAEPGVSTMPGNPNTAYYTGSDPDFPRGSTGAKSNKGGP